MRERSLANVRAQVIVIDVAWRMQHSGMVARPDCVSVDVPIAMADGLNVNHHVFMTSFNMYLRVVLASNVMHNANVLWLADGCDLSISQPTTFYIL